MIFVMYDKNYPFGENNFSRLVLFKYERQQEKNYYSKFVPQGENTKSKANFLFFCMTINKNLIKNTTFYLV